MSDEESYSARKRMWKITSGVFIVFFLSGIENEVVLFPSFCCFRLCARSFYSQLERAVEPRKIFLMPGHYKKIMPAQQPIRACVLL